MPGAPSIAREPSLAAPPSLDQTATDIGSQFTLRDIAVGPRPTPSVVTRITRTGAAQDYPACPDPGTAAFLPCPYCADLLAADYARASSRWRGHVAQDLLPYSCLYDPCPTPDAMYATADELVAHARAEHSVARWVCDACSAPAPPPAAAAADGEHPRRCVFDDEDGWAAHMRERHPDAVPAAQLAAVSRVSRRQMLAALACPLCAYTTEAAGWSIDDHILQHLHGFALRCLPWAEPGHDALDSIQARSADGSDSRLEAGERPESEPESKYPDIVRSKRAILIQASRLFTTKVEDLAIEGSDTTSRVDDLIRRLIMTNKKLGRIYLSNDWSGRQTSFSDAHLKRMIACQKQIDEDLLFGIINRPRLGERLLSDTWVQSDLWTQLEAELEGLEEYLDELDEEDGRTTPPPRSRVESKWPLPPPILEFFTAGQEVDASDIKSALYESRPDSPFLTLVHGSGSDAAALECAHHLKRPRHPRGYSRPWVFWIDARDIPDSDDLDISFHRLARDYYSEQVNAPSLWNLREMNIGRPESELSWVVFVAHLDFSIALQWCCNTKTPRLPVKSQLGALVLQVADFRWDEWRRAPAPKATIVPRGVERDRISLLSTQSPSAQSSSPGLFDEYRPVLDRNDKASLPVRPGERSPAPSPGRLGSRLRNLFSRQTNAESSKVGAPDKKQPRTREVELYEESSMRDVNVQDIQAAVALLHEAQSASWGLASAELDAEERARLLRRRKVLLAECERRVSIWSRGPLLTPGEDLVIQEMRGMFSALQDTLKY